MRFQIKIVVRHLFCAVLGHRYIVERVLNHRARKLGCIRCGGHWVVHDRIGSLLPWDEEFEEFYATRKEDKNG